MNYLKFGFGNIENVIYIYIYIYIYCLNDTPSSVSAMFLCMNREECIKGVGLFKISSSIWETFQKGFLRERGLLERGLITEVVT